MIRPARHHSFWSKASPSTCLCGGGLIIMASDRLAHAMTAAGALIWVYFFSVLAVHAGSRIFPRWGRSALLVFLTTFITSIFVFLLWIISPLCVLEMFFAISLVPIICMASGIFDRFKTQSLSDKLLNSFSEAVLLGLLMVILALIREPFGYLSLSLPGGAQGIVLLFSFEEESFLPIRVVASSCGALLLSGYFLGLYRYFKAVEALRGSK